jgi:hypothetical protein
MAISENPLKLKGSLDKDTSIYPTKNGISIVRKKGGPSRKQINTHPNFEATRRNISIFGLASKLSKNFRSNLQNLLEPAKDGTVNNKLTSIFQKLIREHDSQSHFPQFKSEWLHYFPTLILHQHSPENLHQVKIKKDENDQPAISVSADLKQIKKYLLRFKKSDSPSHFVLLSTLLNDTGNAISHEKSSYIPIRQNSNTVCSIQHKIETKTKLLIHGFRILFYKEISTGNFSLIQNEVIHPGWITKI